jgi:hypothetical protein
MNLLCSILILKSRLNLLFCIFVLYTAVNLKFNCQKREAPVLWRRHRRKLAHSRKHYFNFQNAYLMK